MLVAAGAAAAAAVAALAAAVAFVAAAFRGRYKKKKRTRRMTRTAATPATVPPTIAPIFVVFLVVLVLAVVVAVVAIANDGDAVAEEEKVFPAIKLLVAAVVDDDDNKDNKDNKDEVTSVVLTRNAAATLGFEDKYAAERFPTPVHPPAQALTLQHPQKGGFVPMHVYHSDPEEHS